MNIPYMYYLHLMQTQNSKLCSPICKQEFTYIRTRKYNNCKMKFNYQFMFALIHLYNIYIYSGTYLWHLSVCILLCNLTGSNIQRNNINIDFLLIIIKENKNSLFSMPWHLHLNIMKGHTEIKNCCIFWFLQFVWCLPTAVLIWRLIERLILMVYKWCWLKYVVSTHRLICQIEFHIYSSRCNVGYGM